jgi:3-oxoacyl-[acyl-carrier protein] reductase
MDLLLKGKNAFLTGSSRGIGFAAAKILAEEGSRVVINGRDEQRLKESAKFLQSETGAEIHYLVGDAASTDGAQVLINKAAEKLGGLDLVVTNTGGPPSGKFEAHTEEVWQNATNLVFLSHVRLIRAALPYLKKSSSASVLTITSYSVKQPIPNLILSNSIRAATVGLTKSLALELGSEGIRFNSILPGWTRTERVQEIFEFRAEQSGLTVEKEIEKITAECPLGRMASPDEIGRAAAFLLSPASSYITGVMLTVDGGMVKGTM